MTDFPVGWDYGKRIDRWAKTISQRYEVANGLSHLKIADKERLETLRDGVRLVVVSTRHLGGLLGTVTTAVEATNENASFGLVGSQRRWSNAAPGRLLNTILARKIGNPVVIVDEVEKAGRAHSNKGVAYGLAE